LLDRGACGDDLAPRGQVFAPVSHPLSHAPHGGLTPRLFRPRQHRFTVVRRGEESRGRAARLRRTWVGIKAAPGSAPAGGLGKRVGLGERHRFKRPASASPNGSVLPVED
jgi:hypothetical protein